MAFQLASVSATMGLGFVYHDLDLEFLLAMDWALFLFCYALQLAEVSEIFGFETKTETWVVSVSVSRL